MNIRRDCIHYHCEHDMGASIDCCTLKGLGNCPCTKDCPDYADKAEVYRLGLEALKHPKIHCNECVYGEQKREPMNDPIERQDALDAICDNCDTMEASCSHYPCSRYVAIEKLPPAEPQYTELTPEEAASEISSGSTMSTWYWLDDMMRLKQMGYAICRKKG